METEQPPPGLGVWRGIPKSGLTVKQEELKEEN